ncbi:hypothetical protein EMCRGX_G002424 [Ephydatia muelleri]|eukprot:Em0001g2222a
MKRDDHEVGMTHGGEVMESVKVVWGRRFHEAGRKGYLKLHQLQKPTLNYGCLLIDNLTPAIISILLNQSCPKVMVGDPHQQIYSFKGACNAFTSVLATRTYCLSESIRFGPEIAYVASCLLDRLKRVRRSTIVGVVLELTSGRKRGVGKEGVDKMGPREVGKVYRRIR